MKCGGALRPAIFCQSRGAALRGMKCRCCYHQLRLNSARRPPGRRSVASPGWARTSPWLSPGPGARLPRPRCRSSAPRASRASSSARRELPDARRPRKTGPRRPSRPRRRPPRRRRGGLRPLGPADHFYSISDLANTNRCPCPWSAFCWRAPFSSLLITTTY